MTRLTKSILGATAIATALALAQTSIEPPRRTAPPAAGTETAPPKPKSGVVLPGPAPAPGGTAAAVPATPAGVPANPSTTPSEAAALEKPPIATGADPTALQKRLEEMRARSAAAKAAAAVATPAGTNPSGTPAAPGTTPSVPTTTPGTPAATPGTLPAPTAGTPGTTRPPTIPGMANQPAVPSVPGGTPTSTGLVPAPGTSSGTPVAGGEQFVDVISDPQATLDVVIEEYERYADVSVIRSPSLQGTVPIMVNPKAKMSKEEYVDYLKAALMVNGFSIHEYKKGIHVITFTGQPTPLFPAVPPREGHTVYTRVVDLPDRDEMVNFFLKFDYLSAQDAAQILGQPQHQSGKILAVPNAGGVLIVESVPVVKSLVAIKEKIDVPGGEIMNKFVQLNLADAEEVAGIIQQILQQQANASKSGQGSSGSARVVAPPNAAQQLQAQLNPQGGGAVQTAPDSTSVVVQADRRTNRIMLSGKRQDIAYIEKLIHDFDLPSSVTNLVTYQLRYIKVEDFLDIAAGALEARGFGTSGGAGGATGGGANRNSTQAGGSGNLGGNRFQDSSSGGSSRSSSGSSRSGSSSSGGFGGGFGGGGSGGGGSTRGGYGASSANSQALPSSVSVGKTLLISDPQSNSIIVSGSPESLGQIKDLIQQMDRRPLQVFIDCVVAEVNLGDTLEYGLDILRKVDTINVGGTPVEAAGIVKNLSGLSSTGIIDPITLDSVAAFPQGAAVSGLNAYLGVGELVNAYIRATESTSKVKVIQKPSLATANNEPAYIAIGQQVPYPGQQQSSIVSGNTESFNTSVEYKDVLLSLDVTPLINSKSEVTLQIQQINDNVVDRVQIGSDLIPVISQQELNTKLTVPNGGIAVIGGLIVDSRDNSNSGLPLIARMPILKHIFGSTKKLDKRRELLIFIQPRIMETADEMIEINAREIQRTTLGPEAERFARPGRDTSDVLLPTVDGNIPHDSAGYPPGQEPQPQGFWKRLGGIFKRKTNVPAEAPMPSAEPAPVYPGVAPYNGR